MAENLEFPVLQMSVNADTREKHYHYAQSFVRLCATRFQWKDLSKDVIMDVGCGHSLNCCNAILELFPDVGSLIAIDNPAVIRKAKPTDQRIHLLTGDIEKRETLEYYQGKMSKVISTNTFHLLSDKKLALENVYHMLQRGGQAGIFFYLDSSFYRFLRALLETPKFKSLHVGRFKPDMYPKEHGWQYYKQVFEEIGFRDVQSIEIPSLVLYSTDEKCRDNLFLLIKNSFRIPPELEGEMKEEAFQIYMKTVDRHEGKPCHNAVLLSLTGVKPT